MAVHFHSLQIKQVKKETPQSVSISFIIPAHLQEVFSFREGQNLTLKAQINGEEIRRSYSLCTAPHQGEVKVAIKQVEGGLFSNYAATLKPGDMLEVLPPVGRFNAKQQDATRHLAIAAGSGITPIISIISHILHTDPQSSCTLLYGNQNRQNIIFFEELEALKNKYMHRLQLIYILSREKTDTPLNYGRIDAEKLKELQHFIPFNLFHNVYLCGPQQMIEACNAFLQQAGIAKKNIHFELFTTPGQSMVQQSKTAIAPEKTEGTQSMVNIKLDGRMLQFSLPQNGMSILDAALQQGADLPYACKGGVCCTCRARLVSGKVSMDVNYALEEEELANGFILTCQSHPTTQEVSIDFDVK